MKKISKILIAFLLMLGGHAMAQQAGGSLPKFSNDKDKTEWIKAHPAEYRNAGGSLQEISGMEQLSPIYQEDIKKQEALSNWKALQLINQQKENAEPGFEYIKSSDLELAHPEKKAYILANPKKFIILPDEIMN